MVLDGVYMCGVCCDLVYGFDTLKLHNRLVHNNNRTPHNKAPVQICEGCGSLFLRKRCGYKAPQLYCCQSCYLEHSNPRKDTKVIEKIAMGNRGSFNASKRPEVRKLISDKLTGRDAYWLCGYKLSDKTRRIISEKAKMRWQDPKWAYDVIVRNINGYDFGYAIEGLEHQLIKKRVKEGLECAGYSVYQETPVKIEGHWYIIDILGISDGGVVSIAVECGDCKSEKLTMLRKKFDVVEHISYKKWEELKNESETLSNWCRWHDRSTSCKKVNTARGRSCRGR